MEWLQSIFPGRIPSILPADPREYDALVGEQRVIRKLQYEAEQQTKNALTE